MHGINTNDRHKSRNVTNTERMTMKSGRKRERERESERKGELEGVKREQINENATNVKILVKLLAVSVVECDVCALSHHVI